MDYGLDSSVVREFVDSIKLARRTGSPRTRAPVSTGCRELLFYGDYPTSNYCVVRPLHRTLMQSPKSLTRLRKGDTALRYVCCLFIALLITVPALAQPELTPNSVIPKAWRIAFVAERGIWTANGDGSGRKLVIKGGMSPCWSPDKKRILFARGGNIWVANANGTDQKKLTHYRVSGLLSQDDITISWNRKTGWIAFSRPDTVEVKRGAQKVLHTGQAVFDLDPGTRKASTRFSIAENELPFGFTDNDHPAWSWSGHALAFTRNGDIWICRYQPPSHGGRAGWNTSRLASVARYDSPTYQLSREIVGVTRLSWSPDGTRVAYCINRLSGSGTARLHLLSVKVEEPWPYVLQDLKLIDNSIVMPGNVSHSGYEPRSVCFSQDGKWIAFESGQSVYAVSVDGKRVVKLIANGTQPVW